MMKYIFFVVFYTIYLWFFILYFCGFLQYIFVLFHLIIFLVSLDSNFKTNRKNIERILQYYGVQKSRVHYMQGI